MLFGIVQNYVSFELKFLDYSQPVWHLLMLFGMF